MSYVLPDSVYVLGGTCAEPLQTVTYARPTGRTVDWKGLKDFVRTFPWHPERARGRYHSGRRVPYFRKMTAE